MALPEDLDEQMRQRWLSRLAQERLDLSASVEATIEETPALEDEFPDALETTRSGIQVPQKKAIIPPRLSLQSRVVPAVNPNAPALSLAVKQRHDTWNPDPIDEEPAADEQSTNFLTRLTQRITSSLSALLVNKQGEPSVVDVPEATAPSSLANEARLSYRMYESSLALPVVHAPVVPPTIPALPAPRSTEKQPSVQGKLQVPKRPTKVRLESVSAQETATAANKEMVAQLEERSGNPMGTMLSGSGMFESGRSEMVVANPGVKSSSTVIVMLAGDPGPVVVQYITLRPQNGFTVHLSAPAQAKTPFNYVILSGEQS
jgi:hypothetical protein